MSITKMSQGPDDWLLRFPPNKIISALIVDFYVFLKRF